MITIPTDASGTLREYSQQVELEGVVYTLRISWNLRCERWELSVYALDETAVTEGVAITCGVDLLRGSATSTKPPGLLFAGPTDASVARPDLTGLGGRVKLYYRASDD